MITINNEHCTDCGQPPNITLQTHKAVVYFEGVYGDQFVFAVPRKGTPLLYCGDWGWEQPRAITEDYVASLHLGLLAGVPHILGLSDDEARAIVACWDLIRRTTPAVAETK